MKISLETINKGLRFVGLVLVVGMSVENNDEPTFLWLESAKGYDARTKKTVA